MEPGFCHIILLAPQVCTVVLDPTMWQACTLQSCHLKAPQPKGWGFSSRAWTLALLDICVVFECITMALKTQVFLTPFYRQGTWFLKTLSHIQWMTEVVPDKQVLGFQALCSLIYHLLLGLDSSMNIYWVNAWFSGCYRNRWMPCLPKVFLSQTAVLVMDFALNKNSPSLSLLSRVYFSVEFSKSHQS